MVVHPQLTLLELLEVKLLVDLALELRVGLEIKLFTLKVELELEAAGNRPKREIGLEEEEELLL